MKILITGHMGLIGRAISRRLSQQGHRLEVCDLKGERDCRNTFKVNETQYDLVVHCAWDALPTQRMAIDVGFFGWVDRTDPGELIYISSEYVYPMSLQQEPYRLVETDADPDEGEGMALSRGAKVFRPFQVYGEAGLGVFERVRSTVLDRPDVFHSPACGQVLDFIHVDDVAGAIVSSVGKTLDGPVNLGTGEPTAVDDLAVMMFKAANYEPKRLVCDPLEEQFFRCADVTRMNSIYPATISLSEGIARNFNFPSTNVEEGVNVRGSRAKGRQLVSRASN